MRHEIQLKKKISVIIVTYNRWHLLKQALKSCRLQHNHSELEIILINNGSTDDTYKARYYFPDIKYIEIEKRTIAYARNVGLSFSNCKFITFLDSDDILLPNKLSIQYRYMKEKDIALSFTNYHIYYNNELICYPFDDLKENYWKKFFPYGATSFMFTKQCIQERNLFDNKLRVGEDWDFFLRCKRNNFKIENINTPLYLYRIHDDNISLDKKINHSFYWTIIRLKNRLNPFVCTEGYFPSSFRNISNLKKVDLKDKKDIILNYLTSVTTT